LRNALAAIEWPDDEFRVYATLRGPMFALGDDALLAYRQHITTDGELRIRRLHPMHSIDRCGLTPATQEVADALALLSRLHVGRNNRPIAQTILMLLDAIRAHAGVAMSPTGEQALANCLRMVDMARRFERRGTSSFRAFVERMDAGAEAGQAEDAPVIEQGTEGVRMMTVHRAKGLEFPVVILADPTCSATRDDPSRHVVPARNLWLEPLCGCVPVELLEVADEELRRDRAEAVRLAYVAATRARDLLVVPVRGDQPIDGWFAVVNPTLYPPDAAKRQSESALGCPEFREDSVLDRGAQGVAPPGGSIRPGLHKPRVGDHDVVWWDPSVLALDVEEQLGVRQQRILEVDDDSAEAVVSQENYARWNEARSTTIAQASRASIEVQTVTAFATSTVSSAVDLTHVQVEAVERGAGERPGGRRFGTLVHAVLATVDLDATADNVRLEAEASGRLMDATPEEIGAAVTTVRASLSHSLIRRAAMSASAGWLRRETPIQFLRNDGTLLEGVVDLAFREQTPEFEGWTIVDFKTDHEIETKRDQYAAQVAAYMEAISRSTASPARGFLLIV
jgi:ATP-dependent exoDNAse (exonuclease V) beta subunit